MLKSIRWSLQLWHAGLLAVVLAGFGTASYYGIRRPVPARRFRTGTQRPDARRRRTLSSPASRSWRTGWAGPIWTGRRSRKHGGGEADRREIWIPDQMADLFPGRISRPAGAARAAAVLADQTDPADPVAMADRGALSGPRAVPDAADPKDSADPTAAVSAPNAPTCAAIREAIPT